MSRPLGGGIKQWCCLTSSDDVCRVHREYSWRPQLLEARRAGRRRPGVRRVWAGAGPQRAAYRGGGISWRPPAYSLFNPVIVSGKDGWVLFLSIFIVNVWCANGLVNVSRLGERVWAGILWLINPFIVNRKDRRKLTPKKIDPYL